MNKTKGAKIFVKNEMLDEYLFILRDDNPDIIEPDTWGLLGGGMKKGENPMEAIKRELKEEIDIEVNNIRQIRSRKITHEVHGRIFEIEGYYFIGTTDTYDLSNIKLNEGQRADFFSLEEIMKQPNISQSIEELISKGYIK
ncbi:NUDIX domain-containing protein [Patescibacteria group bacterium]|nr:NUDIX domain-containing protein [Patescibacteria group bacterium]